MDFIFNELVIFIQKLFNVAHTSIFNSYLVLFYLIKIAKI